MESIENTTVLVDATSNPMDQLLMDLVDGATNIGEIFTNIFSLPQPWAEPIGIVVMALVLMIFIYVFAKVSANIGFTKVLACIFLVACCFFVFTKIF